MQEGKIPISLITGFLGSGKTTIINHLLTTAAMAKTAVLVNEFGQISIDSDLIQKSVDSVGEALGTSIVELKNGCVCCSLNEDLGTTLQMFMEKRRSGEMPPFEKVLIETTGLANAGPIIAILMEDPLVRDDYVLDRVITTVDSINGMLNLNLHAESVEQVAVADFLILTKLDCVETETLSELRDRLRKLNPAASLLESEPGRFDANLLFQENPHQELLRFTDPRRRIPKPSLPRKISPHLPMEDKGHPSGWEVQRHDPQITSFCIVHETPVPLQALARFWAALAEEAGPNLLRVKGIVHVTEKPNTPAVVQGVQAIFDEMAWLETWPSDDRRTRLVFIGWRLDEGHIRQQFGEFTE